MGVGTLNMDTLQDSGPTFFALRNGTGPWSGGWGPLLQDIKWPIVSCMRDWTLKKEKMSYKFPHQRDITRKDVQQVRESRLEMEMY